MAARGPKRPPRVIPGARAASQAEDDAPLRGLGRSSQVNRAPVGDLPAGRRAKPLTDGDSDGKGVTDTTMRHGIAVTVLIGTLAAAAACDDDQAPTPTAPTPTTPTTKLQSNPAPTSLAIGGPDSLMVGATLQCQATITQFRRRGRAGRGRGVGIG